MNIGSFVVVLGFSICVYIVLAYGLKECRNRKSSILMLISCIALYEMAEFFYQMFGREYAMVIEFISVWILCIVFLKGYIWRNFFFFIISFSLSNIVFYTVCSTNHLMADIYYREEMGYRVAIWEGALVGCVCIIITIIVVAILKRFFKGKYRGNGILYKIFVVAYITLNLVQIYTQMTLIRTAEDSRSIKPFIIIAPALFSIVLAVCWIFIYDYFEKKRIAREQEKLKNLIRDAYRDLNTSGDGLPALLRTGNIVMDSVLSGYTAVFEEQEVIFENDIEPLKDMEFEEKGIVAIIDNLLGMAMEGNDKSDTAFVKVSLRNVKGAIIIKMESSRGIIQRKKVLSRSMRNIRDRLNFIKDICDMQNGIISLKDFPEECEISVIMV